MLLFSISSGPCVFGTRHLDFNNRAGFTVISGIGSDASDILMDSLNVYYPILDSNNRAKVILETTFSGGITGLVDIGFVVRGAVVVRVEIYGPTGYTYFWDEVGP